MEGDMALESTLKEQLQEYLTMMENPIVIELSLDDKTVSLETKALLEEIAGMTEKITLVEKTLARTPSFSLRGAGGISGVSFAGLPLGHEFSSLVMALLQVSGRPPKIEASVVDQIKSIKTPMEFETYVSLSCHNCPELVQAMNIMSVLNPNISHTMVEGNAFKAEVEAKDILAVPALYKDGAFFEGGRMTIEDILLKLGAHLERVPLEDKEPYEVLIVGGGPAGVSAGIYAARKGVRTGMVTDKFGGQVMDTMGIENFIGTPYTEGPKLAANLDAHMNQYKVDRMSPHHVKGISKGEFIEVTLDQGNVLKSKALIIATGARWRQLGVRGEEKFRNKGVAYCPHCDGPLFAEKKIAVIGGGNSGVEAAIDLAGIVEHVTLVEYMSELKADQVLQQRLYGLENVTVITNAEVIEITGEGKVTGLTYKERASGEINRVDLAGVFVQIGLIPNTDWLKGSIDLTEYGEIITDKWNKTSMEGVFAAGDCTDSPHKQIIISMGTGASASLSAFDYLIRMA